MSRLQNTVRDEASCRRHGPRRGHTPVSPGPCSARRLGTSRPLLYMHLDRLEKAGQVTGRLELSGDGKPMKYFELVPVEMRVTAQTVIRALAEDDGKDALHMEERDQ